MAISGTLGTVTIGNTTLQLRRWSMPIRVPQELLDDAGLGVDFSNMLSPGFVFTGQWDTTFWSPPHGAAKNGKAGF